MAALFGLLLVGCTNGAPWADVVIDAPGADQELDGFSDPHFAVNGARGGGLSAGGTDVYSLDRDGPRTHLVVGFSDLQVVDGEGPDFVVFENAFQISSGGNFMDPTLVEVSRDGEVWHPFPATFAGTTYDNDPALWEGFAGIQPVVHDVDDRSTPDVDDPEAGGDRFDLADLGLDSVTQIRLSAAPGVPNEPVSNGPDIDAVYALNYEPVP